MLNESDLIVDIGARGGVQSLLAAGLIGADEGTFLLESSRRNECRPKRHHPKPPFSIGSFGGDFASEDESERVSRGCPIKCSRPTEAGDVEGELRVLNSVLCDLRECVSPSLFEIDVEEAEQDALHGIARTLGESPRPARVTATHGSVSRDQVLDYLEELGIELTMHETSLVSRHGTTYCAHGGSKK